MLTLQKFEYLYPAHAQNSMIGSVFRKDMKFGSPKRYEVRFKTSKIKNVKDSLNHTNFTQLSNLKPCRDLGAASMAQKFLKVNSRDSSVSQISQYGLAYFDAFPIFRIFANGSIWVDPDEFIHGELKPANKTHLK